MPLSYDASEAAKNSSRSQRWLVWSIANESARDVNSEPTSLEWPEYSALRSSSFGSLFSLSQGFDGDGGCDRLAAGGGLGESRPGLLIRTGEMRYCPDAEVYCRLRLASRSDKYSVPSSTPRNSPTGAAWSSVVDVPPFCVPRNLVAQLLVTEKARPPRRSRKSRVARAVAFPALDFTAPAPATRMLTTVGLDYRDPSVRPRKITVSGRTARRRDRGARDDAARPREGDGAVLAVRERVVRGVKVIDARTAIELEQALGIAAGFWLRL